MILVGARKPPRVRRSFLVLLALVAILGTMGTPSLRDPTWRWVSGLLTDAPVQRVIDDANVLPPGVRDKAEQYAGWIEAESDVDFRLVLTRTQPGESLDLVAPELMRELGAGASTGGQRGLLILYDARTQRGRIEVGYGLEEHFPDGFVGYLLANHVEKLFAAGDPTQGVHLLMRMLHTRIREAVLDRRFDPRVLEVLDGGGHLSGGAGASRRMPLADSANPAKGLGHPRTDDGTRARLGPQKTPEDAYRAYLSWLSSGNFDPGIELFTPETQQYLASLPITPGYFNYILLGEYGHDFTILTRGDRAMLVFTTTPLTSPHFFRRCPDGWQVDIVAEVHNTANTSGVYAWTYRGNDDPYTNRFADELIKIGPYMRLVHGDNRMLPVHDPVADPGRLASND